MLTLTLTLDLTRPAVYLPLLALAYLAGLVLTARWMYRETRHLDFAVWCGLAWPLTAPLFLLGDLITGRK